MKLAIQIPCYNEEKTLPDVLTQLPKKIEGIDEIIVIVINDGSKDKTVEVAQEQNVDIILSNPANIGLAATFMKGITKALEEGADIIINTDGDNQYPGEYIPELIKPILSNKAEIVIGNRNPSKILHFSKLKRLFQKFGSMMISYMAGVKIPDPVSGFRAYSREAAMKLHVHSQFSYTTETLLNSIFAGSNVVFIDIEVNKTDRKSRLASGISEFILKQGITIIKTFTTNRPFFTFGFISVLLGLPGFVLCLRFLYHFINGNGNGYIQSLILAAILIICSFISTLFAIAMTLFTANRKMQEEQIYLLRKNLYSKK